MSRILFVTGTDTGVGKTLLASLLLFHLRQTGVHALAMKPFCSGGREDVQLLQSLQPGELSDDKMNPFYFSKPLAPAVAAGKRRSQIRLSDALKKIRAVGNKCDVLLVEGAGGIMVPLGKDFMVADLISMLNCKVIITARNQLGTINHTLLTVQTLQQKGVQQSRLEVALMGMKSPDISAATNTKYLAEYLAPIPLIPIPFLGSNACSKLQIRQNWPKIRRLFAKMV